MKNKSKIKRAADEIPYSSQEDDDFLYGKRGEFIPWSQAGASSSSVAQSAVDHSGNAYDPELLELAQMEAEEVAQAGKKAKVRRGAKVEGLHGVGQPTIDGFINGNEDLKAEFDNEAKQAAMSEFIRQVLEHKRKTGGWK